jgi:hypothetical protein
VDAFQRLFTSFNSAGSDYDPSASWLTAKALGQAYRGAELLGKFAKFDPGS